MTVARETKLVCLTFWHNGVQIASTLNPVLHFFLPFIVVAVLDLQGSSVSSISTASSYPENLARKKSFIKVALAGINII